MTDECPNCVPDGRRGCVLCDHTGRVPAVTPYTVEAWRERALRAERERERLAVEVARLGTESVKRELDLARLEREVRRLRVSFGTEGAAVDVALNVLERVRAERDHARFMAAGWRRRAKESRANALTAIRWAREARAERDHARFMAAGWRRLARLHSTCIDCDECDRDPFVLCESCRAHCHETDRADRAERNRLRAVAEAAREVRRMCSVRSLAALDAALDALDDGHHPSCPEHSPNPLRRLAELLDEAGATATLYGQPVDMHAAADVIDEIRRGDDAPEGGERG